MASVIEARFVPHEEITVINTDVVSEVDNLSHEDLCEITASSIKRLIAADSLLQDLPLDVTSEEVSAQVAVAQGHSITLTVLRHSENPLHVVVPQQGGTVKDLKLAIQRAFSLKQQRQRIKTKISWKYVWKCYNLQYDGIILRKNLDLLSYYDVKNHSQIRFVRRLTEKNQKSSRNRRSNH